MNLTSRSEEELKRRRGRGRRRRRRMRRRRKRYSAVYFSWMEASGKFHAPATLLQGNEATVSIVEWEVEQREKGCSV
jgi:hypothetical protein